MNVQIQTIAAKVHVLNMNCKKRTVKKTRRKKSRVVNNNYNYIKSFKIPYVDGYA